MYVRPGTARDEQGFLLSKIKIALERLTTKLIILQVNFTAYRTSHVPCLQFRSYRCSLQTHTTHPIWTATHNRSTSGWVAWP